MHRILAALTSRRVSLLLMSFIACAGAIGAWIPQRANVAPAVFAQWQSDNPTLAPIAGSLGLDRVFWTWWFSGALAVFALALAAATARMIGEACRRAGAGTRVPANHLPGAVLAEVAQRARAAGYRERHDSGGVLVMRRRWVGVWASAFMHTGMTVAIVAAVLSTALTSRAVLDLATGEMFEPGSGFLVVDGGSLSSAPNLGRPLRLDGLKTDTWPSGDLKTLTAAVSYLNEGGEWIELTSSANAPLRAFGHTVYVQPAEFGEAAFLAITAPNGAEQRVRMEFLFTPVGQVEYSDVVLDDGTVIQGRWDPHGIRGESPLAVRTPDAADVVLVAEGSTGLVGGYQVEFVERSEWARLIVARSPGVWLLFTGFGIIALGSLLVYLWVPRELVIAGDDEGVRYAWWVPRMGRGYLPELDRILGRTNEMES